MQEIKNLRDFLSPRVQKLPDNFLKLIEWEFFNLCSALGDGKPLSRFDLTEGHIVIVEKEDPPEELAKTGLSEGCFQSSALEFVERFDLGEQEAFRIGILYTNDFMMVFYALKADLTDEAASFLESEADEIISRDMLDNYSTKPF